MLILRIPKNEWMSANDRMHWAERARRTKAVRSRAAWEAKALRLTIETPTLVVVRVGYPTGGRADPSNAAPTVKAAIDGITDSGAWPDDDSEHVIGPHFLRGPKSGEKGVHTIHFTFHNQHIPF